MCRLLLMNKAGEEIINERYGLENFLTYLEDAQGGHGNGIATLRKSGEIKIKKGVGFSTKQAARKLRNSDYEWAIFHTRLSSAGRVSNRNCHPFMIGDTVIAMNGTEFGFAHAARILDKTDTEALLVLIKYFKKPLLTILRQLSSVFIGFDKGKPFAVTPNATKAFEILWVKEENAVVFASQFPEGAKDVYVPKKFPFVWNGQKLDPDKLETPIRLPKLPAVASYNYYHQKMSGLGKYSICDEIECEDCEFQYCRQGLLKGEYYDLDIPETTL